MSEKTFTIHKFEERGLGKAPFRLIGMHEEKGPKVISCEGGVMHTVGAPGQPMGICDYCGTGILYCFEIESADKKKFIVGSDCVYKTEDAGLKKQTDPIVREVKRKARHESEAKKIAEIEGLISDEKIKAVLVTVPHPFEYRAKEGKTILDYMTWMKANAGNSGKMWVYRELKKVQKDLTPA